MSQLWSPKRVWVTIEDDVVLGDQIARITIGDYHKPAVAQREKELVHGRLELNVKRVSSVDITVRRSDIAEVGELISPELAATCKHLFEAHATMPLQQVRFSKDIEDAARQNATLSSSFKIPSGFESKLSEVIESLTRERQKLRRQR